MLPLTALKMVHHEEIVGSLEAGPSRAASGWGTTLLLIRDFNHPMNNMEVIMKEDSEVIRGTFKREIANQSPSGAYAVSA